MNLCAGAAWLLLLGGLSACQNDELEKLDADYRVVTDHDANADFTTSRSYYLPDTILIVGESDTVRYIEGLKAKPILDVFHRNMEQRGYTRAESKEEANLGVQMTYIASTYHFVGYVSTPYWWLGFNGYWHPHYWGNWGYWHYSFPVSFSISTHALLTDMLDLKAEQGTDKQLPVIWQSYITGLQHDLDISILLIMRGIEQAFRQSDYITTSKKQTVQ